MGIRTTALPEGFKWKVDEQRRTLFCRSHPIIEIGPERRGWIARILITGKGISHEEVAVRSLDSGEGWATRWALERKTALLRVVAALDVAS
ncbi:hypothetical protein [Pseudoxanthomonas sp. PXM02]|jgi:hypothetical protein|uniref:hypothetical protein n=1 Tax=Pseudoxanthomonas sp. PXM02 TaxID=2769294 RepID=UPI00177C18E7|nr:hypothetical protein [Pseudoxanthomonas sp. PXM02]MBD9477362.1 hypothetical protein [Pseudoxanthomonas sp. PXM02]